MSDSVPRLRKELFFRSLLAIALLLLVYTFIWLNITRSQVLNAASKNIEVTAKRADAIIQKYFSFKVALLKDLPQSESKLRDLLQQDKDIQQITVISPDDRELIKINREKIFAETDMSDLSNKQEFKQVIQAIKSGENYVSSFSSDGNKNEIVKIAVPTEPAGAIIAGVNINSLLKEINSGAAGGRILISDQRTSFPDDNLVFNTRNGLTKWEITSLISFSEVLVPMAKIQFFAFFLLLAGLIFAALLILHTQHAFTLAIAEILQGLKQFKIGNFNHVINIDSQDELQQISQEINALPGMLRGTIAQVEKGKLVLSQEKQQLTTILFQENEKVNFVLSHIKDAVVILSQSRTVVSLNKAAEEIIGYSAQEVFNRPINQVTKFFDRDREISWNEYAAIQPGKDPVFIKPKVRLENPNITPRYIDLISTKAVFSQKDNLGYILLIHLLQEEIEIEKTEDRFVNGLIQTLQAPLTIINQFFTLFAQNSDQLTQQQTTYLGGIQLGMKQLAFLINNLSTLAQVEDESYSPTLEAIDLTNSIQQVVENLTPLAASNSVSLTFELPENSLPQIIADLSCSQTVITNLLQNAIYSMVPKGGGEASISIGETESEIMVQIQDNGVGIPNDSLQQIFTKFYRVPDTATPGMGLGLYLAKKLIELHHGKIWFDTVESCSSIFSFSLPKTI